ncbi:hypothetical protein [uncultured Bifidobacterium sp.]|uniref:hypothetical protein n=1 Tax=uncultured Bifidobacterium sp. TaxID=165187 RepID=UPI0028DB2929|nr:hypothetical protein [uncultured Bifidobacterium sp.]
MSRRRGGASGRNGRAGDGARSAVQMHREWLELVDAEGPFLSVPVMTELYPQGMPALDRGPKEALHRAKPVFDAAWDAWDQAQDKGPALQKYRRARDTWVRIILTEVIGWGPHYAAAADRPVFAETYRVRSDGIHTVTVAPTGALIRDTGDATTVGALVLVVDPAASLRELCDDGWAAGPIDRMGAMLRATGSTCSIGLVTDGRWWALVSAPRGGATASGVVDAQTWVEEPATRNAFIALLGVKRLLRGAEKDRLPQLFADSVLAAEEVTEALGTQVRRAVELVVSAISQSITDTVRHGRPDPLPDDTHRVYEAVVTVMMRVVFLLFAEERGLLPTQELYRIGYGLAGVLDGLETRARDEGEESMDGTYFVWHRLLATSNAVYHGAIWGTCACPPTAAPCSTPSVSAFWAPPIPMAR